MRCDQEYPGGAAPEVHHVKARRFVDPAEQVPAESREGERCERIVGGCPGGCSGHGLCDEASGKCVCSLGYGGEDCGRSACADAHDPFTRKGCHGRGHCRSGDRGAATAAAGRGRRLGGCRNKF